MKGATSILLAAALAGCASAPTPLPPPVALPAAYGGAVPAGATQTLGADWWTLFGEPALNQLVERTLVHNADLRLAAARVDETAAVLGLARAAQWPGLDLGAGVTRSRSSGLNGQPVAATGPEATSHRLLLSTAFEIDLWGRLRAATAAAQAQLLAAQHAREVVRLAVASAGVQAWFGLRALDAQLAVLDRQLASREASLALVERRLAAGLGTTLERAQARDALAALQGQRPLLLQQRARLQHQIGLLSGQPGWMLETSAQPVLPAPLTPPPGLPAELLQRRPDIAQAEAALAAAQAQVAVARAAMFPTLSLTGSFGGQSTELADLLKGGARVWSLGPSLLLPLFDGGRNMARSEQAQAQAEQAAIGYQRAVLQAYREVADALADSQAAAAQAAPLEARRQAAAEAARVAARRHEAGYSSYLELLEAERSLQEVELAQLRLRQAGLDASLALVKALGGGWQAAAR